MTTIGSLPAFNPSVDDFSDWVAVFESFLCANGLDYTTTEAKDLAKCKGIFLSSLGLPTFSLLGNLLSPDKPASKPLAVLISTLEGHYKPPPKALSERFKFSMRKQRPGESAPTFLAELRKLAITCKFTGDGSLSEHLRDQFIFGLANEAAQKRIFTKEDTLTLEDALQVAVSQEAAESGTTTIRESKSQEVNFVPSSKKSFRGNGSGQGQGPSRTSSTPKGKSTWKGKGKVLADNTRNPCAGCGSQDHGRKDCPYQESECHGCGKKGHLKRVCFKTNKSNSAHAVDPDQDQSEDEYFVSSVNQVSQGPSEDAEFQVSVAINGTSHKMEFDSGCKRSLLSESFWEEYLGAPPLRRSTQVFRSFTGHTFRALGELDVKLIYEGKEKNTLSQSRKGSLSLGET